MILKMSFKTFQLLELPKFQDIIKIKTIGSTYMAASGLNPTRVVKVMSRICLLYKLIIYKYFIKKKIIIFFFSLTIQQRCDGLT